MQLFLMLLLAAGQYYGVVPERRSDKSVEEVLPAFPGTARVVNAKALHLEMHDGNVMVFRCTKKTAWLDGEKKIKAEAVKEGEMLVVEGKKAPDGSMDAVNVRVQREKEDRKK